MYYAEIGNKVYDNISIETIKKYNIKNYREMLVGSQSFTEYLSKAKTLHSPKNKTFCIGYNKTGTTSLEYYFRALGYNVPCQQTQESILTDAMYKGDFDKVKEFISDYDFFQDMPFSQEDWWIVADVLFPNSKFILTVREEQSWYTSYYNWHKSVLGFDTPTLDYIKNNTSYIHDKYIYNINKRQVSYAENTLLKQNWDKLYNKNLLIDLYTKRNTRIMSYFQDRDNLLVIDLSKEKDTNRILEFLDIDKNLICEMPHVNRSR